MERARIICYVRIAVTALSLTACVLLIALWVRSYYFIEVFQLSFPFMRVRVFSETGVVVTWIVHNDNREGAIWMTMPHNEVFSLFSTKTVSVEEPTRIQVPHWLLVILSASFAASRWFSWRLQPPHTANRHDAGCGGIGDNRGGELEAFRFLDSSSTRVDNLRHGTFMACLGQPLRRHGRHHVLLNPLRNIGCALPSSTLKARWRVGNRCSRTPLILRVKSARTGLSGFRTPTAAAVRGGDKAALASSQFGIGSKWNGHPLTTSRFRHAQVPCESL